VSRRCTNFLWWEIVGTTGPNDSSFRIFWRRESFTHRFGIVLYKTRRRREIMVGCSNDQPVPASTGRCESRISNEASNSSWTYGRRWFLNRMICKGSEHFCAKMLTLHCGVESEKVSRCTAGGIRKVDSRSEFQTSEVTSYQMKHHQFKEKIGEIPVT